ncbi:unnamed protein product [Closterium sp. NIES-54]
MEGVRRPRDSSTGAVVDQGHLVVDQRDLVVDQSIWGCPGRPGNLLSEFCGGTQMSSRSRWRRRLRIGIPKSMWLVRHRQQPTDAQRCKSGQSFARICERAHCCLLRGNSGQPLCCSVGTPSTCCVGRWPFCSAGVAPLHNVGRRSTMLCCRSTRLAAELLAPATTATTATPIATTAPTATAATAIAATAAPAYCTSMASLMVLAFHHEGTPVQFDTWLDDLQLNLLSDSKDTVSLFDLGSGAAPTPPATVDSATRSQWLTHDAAARLAICNHLPLAECAHFGQHRTAQALDARYRTTGPAEFLDRNQPPMFITLYCIVTRLPGSLRSVRDHFLSFDPTSLTVDLLEQHLLAAESSAVAVDAARGTLRPAFFEGCSPSPLAPSYTSAAAADVLGAEDVGAASASAKSRSGKDKGSRGGGGGSGSGGGGSSGGSGGSGGGGSGRSGGGSVGVGGGGGGGGVSGGSGGGGTGGVRTSARRGGSGGGQRQQQQRRSETQLPQQLHKLSARAIPCVFLGFVPDAPSWQFYHPTSRRVLSSQDVTFDESVPFYRLFPYRSAPLPPPPHFLAPGPSAVDSGSVRGITSGGAELRGAESGDVEPGGTATGGAELGGTEPGGAGTGGAEPGGAESEGAESGGAKPQGAASSRGSAGASPRKSPLQLREWLVRRARLWIGATRAGGAGAAGVGGAGVPPGAGVPEGTAATGPGGSRTRGSIAAGTGGVGGAGAGDPTKFGAAGAGGSGTNDTGAGGAGVGGIGTRGARVGVAGAGGAGAVNPGGTVRPRPYYVPLLQQVLGVPSSPDLTPPLLCPPPDESQLPLQPASPLPTPSPYTEPCGSLNEHREPVSRQFSPVCTARRVPRSRPTPSSLPEVPDPESNRARAACPTVSCLLATAVTDPSFGSAVASALVAELLDFAAACRLEYATALVAESASACPPSVGDPDAPDIPTPRSYAEAITGTFSSHWQAAKDAEIASWKSTGTYVDEVPPPGANIVDGMWIFRVKRQPGSPPTFKARYVARGFSQRQRVDYFHTFSPTPLTTLRLLLHVAAQRDYELHSLDFSTAFQQGSLHKEIWLRRPPGFTGPFPTDRGGEFLGKEFTDFVDGKGIVHDPTCPYTPQQNGMAEREMRTAVESVRMMLLHMGVQHH